MKLITDEFINTMKKYPFGSQSEEKDPFVPAKFFNPCGAGTWFIYEYNPETKIAFAYVIGLGFDELGAVSIKELENTRLPLQGLTIEKDLHFRPGRLSECCSSFKPV